MRAPKDLKELGEFVAVALVVLSWAFFVGALVLVGIMFARP